MEWVRVADEKPAENQEVWYYFFITGVSSGVYNLVDIGEGLDFFDKPVMCDCFSGSSGFLIDEATHWMPLTESPPTAPNN